MRVDDRNLAGSQATQSGQANQAQQVGRSHEVKPADIRPAAGADRVELSGLTGDLARALAASGRERAGRIAELAQEYSSGRYHVDARAVSRAIVAEMRALDPKTAGL
ncbi:MAG: flagellar biosynthesis anti-sigma factor FlgM [Bryobacterales bacterium]|nr:flagellar biosynthesis anti-sigma factor FlgM [Bryobacterales bacterium]